MTEHDKFSSDVETTAPPGQVTAPSQGRRRFVKGAMLAGPAIITLRTGSALAQQPSLGCCDKPNPGWESCCSKTEYFEKNNCIGVEEPGSAEVKEPEKL